MSKVKVNVTKIKRKLISEWHDTMNFDNIHTDEK